jgi:hypothetical protein
VGSNRHEEVDSHALDLGSVDFSTTVGSNRHEEVEPDALDLGSVDFSTTAPHRACLIAPRYVRSARVRRAEAATPFTPEHDE